MSRDYKLAKLSRKVSDARLMISYYTQTKRWDKVEYWEDILTQRRIKRMIYKYQSNERKGL